MRFTATVVGKNGMKSSMRPRLPGNVVRMDDQEQFRLFFENDWDIEGIVKFVYDGNNNTDAKVYMIEMPPMSILASEETFTFDRVPVGEGRLLEISFQAAFDSKPFQERIMFINNDYRSDGTAIQYGDVQTYDVVLGRNTNPQLNPDKHTWADFPYDD